MSIDLNNSFLASTDGEYPHQGRTLKMQFPWMNSEPPNSTSAPVFEPHLCKRILYEDIFNTRYDFLI